MRKNWKRFLALSLVATMLLAEMPQNVRHVSAHGQQTETLMETETDVYESSEVAESESAETVQEDTAYETQIEIDEESVTEESLEEQSEETLESTEQTVLDEITGEVSKTETSTEMETSTDFVIKDGVLKQYKGSAEEVTIPDGVIEIDSSVFCKNNTIKKVIFPSSLQIVGDYAFQNCTNLYQVELNEGLVKIGASAFEGASLGQVLDTGAVELGKLTIPSTVQYIGDGAFYNCCYLEEVVFENGENETLRIVDGNDGYYSKSAFGSCENLIKVDLPDRLEVVAAYAFNQCNMLKDVTFGSGTRTIGEGAFYECSSLRPVIFNDGLVTIGSQAFYKAAMGEVLDTGKIECGTITIPASVQYIHESAFSGCKYLGEVIFEDGENEILQIDIGYHAESIFDECINLTKVDLPERLKEIPQSLFAGNGNLVEVLLGNSTETIGDSAFSGCDSLQKIVIPATVTTICDCAFSDCSSLEVPKLQEGLKTIGDAAFYKAALLERLGTEAIDLGTLTIPSTVQTIGESAFSGCEYLGEVIFADGDTVVLNIAGTMHNSYVISAFGNCENLYRVDLPERLEAIPLGIFYECPQLREVCFGKNVHTISQYAFYDCQSLCNVKLNEGLKTIEKEAFCGTAIGGRYDSRTGKMSPGTLTIPSTVQSIGREVFYGCDYLKKVIFENGETVVLTMDDSFGWCDNLTTVILPERIQSLDVHMFNADYGYDINNNMKIFYIPQGVTNIEGNLSYYCPNVTIYGVPGSMAEVYADEYQIPFKNKDQLKIDDDEPVLTDSKPGIDDSKCIINLYTEAKKGTLFLYPANGYEIDTQSLVIKNSDGSDSPFTITKVEGSNTQYAITGTNLAKKNYKVVLHVKTSAGEKQPYKLPFVIQVTAKQPQVKVTQEALKLYERDGRGKVMIDADTAISNITYTPNFAQVVLEQKEINCEENYFTYGISSNAIASNYLTAGTKGTLEILFEGYSEPYRMNLNLKVDKKLPKLKASSITLYPTKGIDETTIKIIDETGNEISASDGYLVTAANTRYVDVILMSDSSPLKVKAKYNAKNETLKLNVSNTNWIPSVKVSCAVKVAKNPKLVFSNGKVTLNTLDNGDYKFATKQVTVIPYIQGASDVEIADITFTGKNAKSQSAYMDGNGALLLKYDNGVIKAGVDNTVAKGTYSFIATAVTKDGLTVSGTFTISVTNAKPDVTVNAKGTIDVLNRKGSSVVYTIAPKNFSDQVVNVSLTGSNSEFFDLTYENGKATLRAREDVELKIKSNYQLSMKVTFASGAELTKKIMVKLSQKNPKLFVSPSKTTLFQFATGTGNGQNIAVRAAGGADIAKVELVTGSDTFLYDYVGNGKGTLYVSGDGMAKSNKTYSLKFAVTLKDAATNANPIYVTIKVSYKK